MKWWEFTDLNSFFIDVADFSVGEYHSLDVLVVVQISY